MTHSINEEDFASHTSYQAPKPDPKNDLLTDIDSQIQKVENDGGYNDSTSQWKDKTSRYPQKFAVLNALKSYLNGQTEIDALRKTINENPKYDKGIGRSATGKLVDRVLEFKGETLEPRRGLKR